MLRLRYIYQKDTSKNKAADKVVVHINVIRTISSFKAKDEVKSFRQ